MLPVGQAAEPFESADVDGGCDVASSAGELLAVGIQHGLKGGVEELFFGLEVVVERPHVHVGGLN